MRRERLQIGADLVADIARGRRAVGADDAEIDPADLHQMAAGVIDDDRMGDAVLAEFPRRQGSALVARPRLVDPDMHGNAGVMRLVDGRGGGAPVDGREPAGIAMGENIDGLAGGLARRRGPDEGEAMIADRRAERDILLGDASGAGKGCRRAFAGRQRHDEPTHPFERPGEIDGGRPCRGQTFAGAGEAGVGRVFAQSKGDAIGGGHADERRAAHRTCRRSRSPLRPAWRGGAFRMLCGSLVWSMISTSPLPASHEIVRKCLPPTRIGFSLFVALERLTHIMSP